MRFRVLICVVLVSALAGPAARAADPPPKPGTTFQAETKGAPATAMTGHWEVDGLSARLVWGGAHVVGTRTDMRATWTSGFSKKTRSGSLTVECYRVSGSAEDKANKWFAELRMIPKSGLGKGAFSYSTRVPMTELGSGEGISVGIQSFRPQRWMYQVVLGAKIVTHSELSGTCTVEAG